MPNPPDRNARSRRSEATSARLDASQVEINAKGTCKNPAILPIGAQPTRSRGGALINMLRMATAMSAVRGSQRSLRSVRNSRAMLFLRAAKIRHALLMRFSPNRSNASRRSLKRLDAFTQTLRDVRSNGFQRLGAFESVRCYK